jgi:MerR family transcriptional regulator, copper efflux regulator
MQADTIAERLAAATSGVTLMTSPRRTGATGSTGLSQIGEVSELLGLSIRTIRHYEGVGVVHPSSRTLGGFRLYSESDIDRLRQVMGMKPLGFSLEEIHELLDLLEAVAEGEVEPSGWARLEFFKALTQQRTEMYERNLALVVAFNNRLQSLSSARTTTT